MYRLPDFIEKDQQVVLDFMRQHPFAMLIGCHEQLPVATQIPLLLEEKSGQLFLKGHIMRQTDHHKAFQHNENVLCVFTGPHAYVSASWYTNPKIASTWNYMSVHVRGKLTFLDEAALIKILEKTTAHFEQDEHSPASFHQLPKDYVEKLAKAIVAFEIEVKQIDNVFKLSQNRDQQSYQNIIHQLEKGDGDAVRIAQQMKNRKAQLFPSAG